MSEDSPAPETPAPAAKKARRISNPNPTPRARKTAKKPSADEAVDETLSSAEARETAPAPAPAPAPVNAPAPDRAPEPEPAGVEAPDAGGDDDFEDDGDSRPEGGGRSGWPEVETIQGGDGAPTGKRKRRRKKKGGQGQGQGQGPQVPHGFQPVAEAHRLQPGPPPERPSQALQQQPQQGPRVPLDPEEVAKKAWKIFLGEVGEEGLALIGDQDARDLSRRSFRLAEIFLEEKVRRTR